MNWKFGVVLARLKTQTAMHMHKNKQSKQLSTVVTEGHPPKYKSKPTILQRNANEIDKLKQKPHYVPK